MSRATQELLNFVRQLPEGMAYAPIYCAGSKLQSGKESKGKAPLERSHHQVLNPADVALQIERRPEVFQAVGVFTGARSAGLVILDVDRNLSRLLKKWGETLEGAPKVTSTKANAAKYLFRVPEALWGDVKGFGLSDTGAGYEVLWGRQGLLYGAYPGSSDGKAPAGEYGFEGDLEAIPEAPAWLLAEMRDHAGREMADGGFIKNRKALDFSDRTREEVAEIVQSALRVIPGQGAGSRDHWVKVGMAIHSELPDDLGMTLWSAWSAEDPEYASDWEDSNPCQETWKSFKRGKVTLGSLFWMADNQIPGRLWLDESLRKVVADAEQKATTYNFDEIYTDLDKIFNDETASVGRRRYSILNLARKADIRTPKPVQELTEMYLSELEKRTGKNNERSALERYDNPAVAHYYMPGVLCQGVYVLSGAGGAGKSNTAWAFARHVLGGIPMVSPEGKRTVEEGSVLWLSGDQMDASIDDQLITHLDRAHVKNLHIQGNFNINDYPSFITLAKRHKPTLVVIDSLRSTHRGTGVSENDSEFALPLRWYEQMMGDLFPACMILVIHHSGHNRSGARGTSAITDMVTFSMNFLIPDGKGPHDPARDRLVVFTKHRFGLKNHAFKAQLRDDSKVTLEYVGPLDQENAPTSVQDRVRHFLSGSERRDWTLEELEDIAVIQGSKEAIKKALNRLEREGLVCKTGSKRTADKAGRPSATWGASGAVLNKESFLSQKGQKACRTKGLEKGTALSQNTDCPDIMDAAGASDQAFTSDQLAAFMQQGADLWK